jgi:hypothetical protein
MLSEAGFRWVRMDLKWDLTEVVKGKYDFAAYDRLMAALDQYGLHALFILDYASPLYDKGAPPHTAEARQAFANWAVAAAKHFAGRDVIWETYNEPNIAQFWPPRPNVDDYVALALAVGRAFRESVPAEKLVGPATSGIDFDFLESCFKAGLLEYWTAVSVHPYRRSDPETAAQDYCRLQAMIETYAPVRTLSSSDGAKGVDRDSDSTYDSGGAEAKKAIPILSGEWGYSSTWRDLNDDRQGQLLARQWLTNAANGIALSIWYDWRDDGSNANEPEHHFGTVYNSYHEGRESVFDPKPAYLAAKTLTTFLRGYQFEKRQRVGGNDDYVFVFRKAGEVRIAAWTTASRARRIVIPLEPALYQSMTNTGQSGTVVQADQNGLAVNLTEAPVYLSRYREK